jgi:hypothetical protein
MRAYGWRLGQRGTVTPMRLPTGSARRRATMRIVGVVVLPSFSEGGFAATNLGQGASVTTSLPSAPCPPAGCVLGLTCYSFLLMRLGRGRRRVRS